MVPAVKVVSSYRDSTSNLKKNLQETPFWEPGGGCSPLRVGTSNFTMALAVLFASYYVFNIEYPAEAATPLEFIQRFFVRINPERSKCAAKTQVSRRTGKTVQRKNKSLNPHVASFIRDFIDYDWKN